MLPEQNNIHMHISTNVMISCYNMVQSMNVAILPVNERSEQTPMHNWSRSQVQMGLVPIKLEPLCDSWVRCKNDDAMQNIFI